MTDPNFNPAAEAFRSFDQDQGASAVGSVHLDTDEEPRRGTSRANSVRFDESALHGHFAHGSRSSSDFFPTRTGSGMGSHPMTERSLSHKSEGRQSSNGQSTRLNSLHLDTRPSPVLSGNPLGPPPGLLVLGPVPAIIRCWLDTNFSNESLLYAAICTGSCHSFIQGKLAQSLDQTYHGEIPSSGGKVRLDVFLPEAVFQQSTSRPSSPATQLPMITVEFLTHEHLSPNDSIQVVIGSDVLRLRNADILLSQDRVTLFDDRHNKVAVPLVRPENPNAYRNLVTLPSLEQLRSHSIETDIGLSEALADQDVKDIETLRFAQRDESCNANKVSISHKMDLSPEKTVPFSKFQDVVVGEGGVTKHSVRVTEHILPAAESEGETQEHITPSNGLGSDPQATPDSGRIWSSWRRDPGPSSRPDLSHSDAVPPSASQRTGQGRGMKVLKPLRSNTSSRPLQNSNVTTSDQQEIGSDRASYAQSTDITAVSTSRKSFSGTSKSPIQGTGSRSRPMNPVGGASAFGWLTSDQHLERKMSAGT